MNGLKQLALSLAPYLIAIVVTVGVYLFVEHKWQEDMEARYNAGVTDGKRSVVDEYEFKAAQLRNNWAKDKELLEHEAQQRLNAAKADADSARDAADSLQRTINQIRSIADHAGVSVTPGTSTGQAIHLLADMLVESNRRANTYAEFADRAFEAGRTCELQYDNLRKRVNDAKIGN